MWDALWVPRNEPLGALVVLSALAVVAGFVLTQSAPGPTGVLVLAGGVLGVIASLSVSAVCWQIRASSPTKPGPE